MEQLTKLLQQQLDKMCGTGKLFRSSLTGLQVWEAYLNGFSKEEDPIFRDPNSSTHNCNLCNNFIRRYGNIVAIDENFNVITMFDFDAPEEYHNAIKAVSIALKASEIQNVFFETFNELNSLPYGKCNKNDVAFMLGIAKNHKRYTKEEAEKFGVVKPNEIKTFSHLCLNVPAQFVDKSGSSEASILGEYRDAALVLLRGLNEIPLDTLVLVKDLIKQGSLLNGDSYLHKIEAFIPLKQNFDAVPVEKRFNWVWAASYKLPIAKFRNELIGVLCTELAEGKELNDACKAWNYRVDPVNYMKATAPITKKQIEEAKAFVAENGYEESFSRRFANIDDIKASEVLHSNVGDGKLKSVSVFDNVKSTSTRHKRSEFDKVEEIGIEKFMSEILPSCTSVEAFLMNNHGGNLVTLTTANNPESKRIFKWDNNYSWTFNGNLAGKSQLKEAVKSRGGNVEGVVRVTLSFPDTTDDYDLHIIEPNRNQIYHGNIRTEHNSSGRLDLDAQGRDGHQVAEKRVENIIYTDKARMPKGDYQIIVNNYSGRGLHTTFVAEIEIEGDITVLKLNGKKTNNQVLVSVIRFNGNEFELMPTADMEIADSKSVSKELYGLETNEFYKVNLVCLSPNYWDTNKVGNKHYFFMLDGCKCPTAIRSFHNENLVSDLLDHRKVMEVLSGTTMIEPADKQLSGLGFNATVRDELIVRVQGSHKRVLKVKF